MCCWNYFKEVSVEFLDLRQRVDDGEDSGVSGVRYGERQWT